MRAPEQLTTRRLTLRRPTLADAPAIFARYAGDDEVTRWLGWPRHRAVADTEAFVRWSDQAWASAPCGPLLAYDAQGALVGSTGLDVETGWRASTGYVLARDAWGQGYATELAIAMRELAAAIGLSRVHAYCHVDHRASARVLDKAGFAFEGVLRRHTVFPNLPDRGALPHDVLMWAWVR